MKRRKIILCEHCIEAIRSHGEKVIIESEADDANICEWCDEPEDDLYECYFK